MTIVYILTNEAMPGYIKIGLTEQDVRTRMLSLDTTSVPLPFQCYYAARVEDSRKVERALHTAFGDHRVRSSREFFNLDPYRVRAVLELLALEDVTPRDEVVANDEDEQAIVKATRSKGRFNLASLGIKVGEILTYAYDPTLTAQVASENSIIFNGQELSISKAAHLALSSRGYNWKAVSGSSYWVYNGETLAAMRSRLESFQTEEE